MSSLSNFWYIACQAADLKPGAVIGAQILEEWVAVYRDASGNLNAVQDRCLHRNARLSKGFVKNGELVCPYHGWRYGAEGELTGIPSEADTFRPTPKRCLKHFHVVESEGYIYVCLGDASLGMQPEPYKIPFVGRKGYRRIQLKHTFNADVPNCAENFVDIPHTSYVHSTIFRYQKAPQKIIADVELREAAVHIRYLNETSNFGIFSSFLNSSKDVIFHEDHYYAPNITHVEYKFKNKHFNIISQSVPSSDGVTQVYTDLVYDYGIWNLVARPFITWVGKKIIAQDVKIMKEQSEVIKKYGVTFASTRADIQHLWIEQIYECLVAGKDPLALKPQKKQVEFWI